MSKMITAQVLLTAKALRKMADEEGRNMTPDAVMALITHAEDLECAATETTAKLLHRVPAAARLLDISTAQAYNLINRGELDAIRLGSSLRVPERALQKIASGGQELKS